MFLHKSVNLSGKNILVTGAASGIGKATSLLLSHLGADLVLIDKNETGLNSTISQCTTRATGLVVDLTDEERVKNELLPKLRNFGKLHGMAHIAGIPSVVPLKIVNTKICTEVFQINTCVAIELSKIFSSPHVFAGETGSIVFVSSVYALVGSVANVAYAASKAALHGVTKSLAIELASKKIRVNCLAPGFVKTDMMKINNPLFDEDYLVNLAKLHPLGLGEPEDIAWSVAFLLSDVSKWITGSIITIDGGFTAQ